MPFGRDNFQLFSSDHLLVAFSYNEKMVLMKNGW